MAWEAQCAADIRHLLYTLEQLPMDKAQAASNVQPLLHLSTTRFAAVPSQAATAAQSGSPASPKSLHRSLTDVDAARRRQQTASLSGHTNSNGVGPHREPAPTQKAAADEQPEIQAEAPQQFQAEAPQLQDSHALAAVPEVDEPDEEALSLQPQDHPLGDNASQQGVAPEQAQPDRAASDTPETDAVQDPHTPVSVEVADQQNPSVEQEAETVLSSGADGEDDMLATGDSGDTTQPGDNEFAVVSETAAL